MNENRCERTSQNGLKAVGVTDVVLTGVDSERGHLIDRSLRQSVTGRRH